MPVRAQPLPETLTWELVGPTIPTSVDSTASTEGLAFLGDTLVVETGRDGFLTAVPRADPTVAWADFRVRYFSAQGPLSTVALTAGEAAGEPGTVVAGAEALFLDGALRRAGPSDVLWSNALPSSSEGAPVRGFGGALYAGTNEWGNGSPSVARSTDGGRTWAPLQGYSGVYPYALAYAERVPEPPDGGLPHGALVSADAFGLAYAHGAAGGGDPGTAETLAWSSVPGVDVRSYSVVAVQPGPRDGGKAGRFLAAVYDGADSVILASDDAGSSWSEVFRAPLPGAGFYVLGADDGAVYGYFQGFDIARHLYGSADGGETWADLGRVGLEWRFGIEQLVAGPDGRLYAGGGDGTPGYNPLPGEPAGGVFRTVEQVVVAAVAPAPPSADSIGVHVFPNPSNGASSVTLAGIEPATNVRIAVYDMLGREVAVLHDGPFASGQRFPIEADMLAPGLYVVRAEVDGQVATARFSVVE